MEDSDAFYWVISSSIKMNVYFTSERNSYGITNSDWKDGKVFSVETSIGDSKGIAV